MTNPLVCNCCGEIGRVVRGDTGFHVIAKCGPDSGGQCQTAAYVHEADAIAAWGSLWDEDGYEDEESAA